MAVRRALALVSGRVKELPLGDSLAGIDGWTYLKLAAAVNRTLVAAADVAGMAFTPAANTDYIIEGQLLLRTAAATTGARIGIAWPTAGVDDGVAEITAASAAAAAVLAFGNPSAALLNANTGHPTTTASWPARLHATLRMGATVAGNWRLQLASEVAASQVTLRAGSWLRYRSY